MRGDGDILLVSTYELGHQPLGLALPRAFLARAGFRPAALDLSVEPLDEAAVRRARLVAFAVPMHTALKLALAAAARVRELNPAAHLAFHGLYAPLHAPVLRAAGAVAVLGGECEDELVRLAQALDRGEALSGFVEEGPGAVPLRRLDFPVPRRDGLPPLSRYARLEDRRGRHLAGYVEATRGCLHRCRHCPIPPLYQGRFFAVPVETVLADVAQLVAAGAAHVTFGDPDFLNGPGHALRVARALHARFPQVTFDYTAKVEHLLRRPLVVAELAGLGAVFVTSAVESLSDRVLAALDKGHTRADALRAFELCAEAGVTLRPSLLPFTPWSTLDDYLDLLETFEQRSWLPQLDPVQLSIRLLVPPGSLLLRDAAFAGAALDPAALTYRWAHPDPRMDALQARVAALVEERAAAGADPLDTIAAVKALALAAAGRAHAHVARARERRFTPRLTESWFC